MTNKLFCTFSTERDLDRDLDEIRDNYRILFDRIFVLYAEQTGEYLCTYNIDLNEDFIFPKNTILVHRKKETNTLYTINALNALIIDILGYLDSSYRIYWPDFRNCILLTRNNRLQKLDTEVSTILYL